VDAADEPVEQEFFFLHACMIASHQTGPVETAQIAGQL
jgi:hypothetical protein